MGGKRYADNKNSFDFEPKINYKKVILVLLIIILIIAIIIGVIYFVKNRKKEEPEEVVNTSEIDEKKMPQKYEGYDVLGQIVIDKISLKSYILNSTENDAMDKAPVKLFGEELNKEGNFCIAGHNYDEIFAKLVDLEVGDEFYIEDIDGNIQDYKVSEILEVEPTDLKPLMPVEGKTEVTLITCEEEATQRLVIKAESKVPDSEESETEGTETEETDAVNENTATNEV